MSLPYKTLLVPLDGSPTAACALQEGAYLARISGAAVHLLHIVDAMEHITGFERPEVHIREIRPRFLQAGRQLLDEAAAQLAAQNITVHTRLHESGGERVSELIADEAARIGADLVVLGTHGRRGIDRVLMGSDAEQLARIAPVPVLLVRARRVAAP